MNASRWPAKDRGYVVGIAGNQTARAGQFIRELHLPADVIATSDDWGAEKPAPAFFDKLIARAGMAPEEIAYLLRPEEVLRRHSRGVSDRVPVLLIFGSAPVSWPGF